MYTFIPLQPQLNTNEPCVLLLGGFDGIHAGHASLFQAAKAYGLPIGITSIMGGKGKSLFTFSERQEMFSSLGADFVLQMDFHQIQTLSPKQFLDALTKDLQIKAFICGQDFRFGFQAAGDVQFLKEYTHGRVEIQTLVQKDGEKIATTTIKRAIEDGNIQQANALLSSLFFVKGIVQKDRGVGKTIGFPTANIAYPSEKLPLKQGVYHTQVRVGESTYQAITNYGARPTFNNDSIWTETHLIGFDGNLYGKTLSVQFLAFLREIKKFTDANSLKKQLKQDVQRTMQYENRKDR